MNLSIVIPAYNEEKLLPRTLQSVQAAAGAFTAAGWTFELIVCDNNSTDGTALLARAGGARVVFEPLNQIARARNTGARDGTLTARKDSAGRVVGLMGYFRNVTEQKRAEATMRMTRDLAARLNSARLVSEVAGLTIGALRDVDLVDVIAVYVTDSAGGVHLAGHAGLSPEFVARETYYGPASPHARFLADQAQGLAGSPPESCSGDSLSQEGVRALGEHPHQAARQGPGIGQRGVSADRPVSGRRGGHDGTARGACRSRPGARASRGGDAHQRAEAQGRAQRAGDCRRDRRRRWQDHRGQRRVRRAPGLQPRGSAVREGEVARPDPARIRRPGPSLHGGVAPHRLRPAVREGEHPQGRVAGAAAGRGRAAPGRSDRAHGVPAGPDRAQAGRTGAAGRRQLHPDPARRVARGHHDVQGDG